MEVNYVGKKGYNRYSNTNNLRWHDHPNFRWGGNQGEPLNQGNQNLNPSKPNAPYQPPLPFRAPKDQERKSTYSSNPPFLYHSSNTEPNLKREGKEHAKEITLRSVAMVKEPIQSNLQEKEVSEKDESTHTPSVGDGMGEKEKIVRREQISLNEECNAVVLRRVPPKLKDPSSFTIPIEIDKVSFGKALCDIGASINLMSLSIYRRLGLGELKETTVTLQFADRSLFFRCSCAMKDNLEVNEDEEDITILRRP
ncbi:uncharacterized protein LOC105778968 [Gossypium raimondii]|uniref:uncharacterized protein LOC105778968 n=1 Tax=Gossypium raimondii TaxID=29730 RepID=UPI00063AF2CD|nr:uncharacterized protein LOC105778968 [Gossypium raimondii]